MALEEFRNLVIGCGEAGKYLAWHLAKNGEPTAVIERSMIGGSCPNIACLPSKNLIYSAKVVSLVNPETGLKVVSGSTTADMVGVLRRKRKMVDDLTALHLANFKSSGAELIMGEAQFKGAKMVEVTSPDHQSRLLRGERVFLSLGSRASMPAVPGLAAAEPMTHIEALNLQRSPDHLIVIGGGYVGLEFAQALRRLGSRITIIQHGPRLLDREDPDVSAAILELLRDEGIEILLQTDLLAVEGRSREGVKLRTRSPHGEVTIEGSDLLVAAGRTPNTDRIDLASTGVELTARGFIHVNEKLETSAPEIWAMGDCAGSPQFTHVAYDDFRVVRDNLAGGDRTTRDRLIPYCLFTDPELAHVGRSESEAQAMKMSYRLFQLPMSRVMRSHTLSETRGFMKALIGADNRILGFTAFGAEASELMGVVQTAMLSGMPYTALRDAIFAHPTVSEGLVSLFTSGTVRDV